MATATHISPTLTDTDLQAEIGRRLRETRTRARLEIQEVARQTGLSRRTVYRAERGDNPTLATLLRLLRLYGRLGELEMLLRPAEVSPMAVIEAARRKQNKPSSRSRRVAPGPPDPPTNREPNPEASDDSSKERR